MSTKTVYYLGGRHPCFNEGIVKFPPKGFHFKSNIAADCFDINREYDLTYSITKKMATSVYNILNLPRIFWTNTPCNLIHTFGGFIPLNRKPWVTSLEYAASFLNLQNDKMQNPFLLSTVASYLANGRCKKILPFSEACKKSIGTAFKPYLDRFANKLEVVYPAIDPAKFEKKKHNSIKLLHISGNFFNKGGRELIRAFEILEKKYDVELFMIVDAPVHSRSRFKDWLKEYDGKPNIHLITKRVSRKLLSEKYFSDADIFVLPSYVDTFAYTLLEAMAHDLPLVGTDVFALPEIIDDGQNGFVIHSPLSTFNSNYVHTPELVSDFYRRISLEPSSPVIVKLVEKISLLIDDTSLRRNMSTKSSELVRSGKFSIAEQNRKLTHIYENALHK